MSNSKETQNVHCTFRTNAWNKAMSLCNVHEHDTTL